MAAPLPGLRRPAQPPSARGRGGTAPPQPSEVGTRPAGSGSELEAIVYPRTPPLIPSPWSYTAAFIPNELRFRGSPGVRADWRRSLESPEVTCLTLSPLSLPEGPHEPFNVSGCPLCGCWATTAACLPRPDSDFDPPHLSTQLITAAFSRDLSLFARCP